MHAFGIELPKVPYPGFLVILTEYWSVPFSSDEALQISGLKNKVNFKILRWKVFCKKYICYEKSDQFL